MGINLYQIFTKRILTVFFTKLYHGGKIKGLFPKIREHKRWSIQRNIGIILSQIFTRTILIILYTKVYHGGKIKGLFPIIKKRKK